MFPGHSPSLRGLGIGTCKQEPQETVACWLTMGLTQRCIPSMHTVGQLSYTTQNCLPRDGSVKSGLGPSITVIKTVRPPPVIPTGHSDLFNFLIEAPTLK